MSCECCDNVLQHRVRYILAHDEHAPIDLRYSRRTILDELEEALNAYDEEMESRREARRLREALR